MSSVWSDSWRKLKTLYSNLYNKVVIYIWKDALIILYHFIIFEQVFHTFTWKTASLFQLEMIIYIYIVYFSVLLKPNDIFDWLSKWTHWLLWIFSCTWRFLLTQIHVCLCICSELQFSKIRRALWHVEKRFHYSELDSFGSSTVPGHLRIHIFVFPECPSIPIY